jgi:hypothetical protein
MSHAYGCLCNIMLYFVFVFNGTVGGFVLWLPKLSMAGLSNCLCLYAMLCVIKHAINNNCTVYAAWRWLHAAITLAVFDNSVFIFSNIIFGNNCLVLSLIFYNC